MDEFTKLSEKLQNGPLADRLRRLASSPEGERLARGLDPSAVEDAARRGDMEAMKKILSAVLSTGEGQSLAMAVKKAMRENNT